jgi:predicted CXXCH cytochrome family protein
MKGTDRIKQVFIWGSAIFLLTHCSPYAGKNLLNFFFDGVPESDTTRVTAMHPSGVEADSLEGSGLLAAREVPSRLLHYPYEEGECATCHNEASLGTLVEAEPGLCYLCHEDLSDIYKYLHGPVAGGYCTACHDPHMSESAGLLRMTGDELCFYCHEQASVLKNEMHQDLEGMSCTDCHNPHGGEDRYIFQ